MTNRYNNTELTDQQYKGLSWLAYYNRMTVQQGDNDKASQQLGSYYAAKGFCLNVLNIPEELVYKVTLDNECKGLINYNKMSLEYWEY